MNDELLLFLLSTLDPMFAQSEHPAMATGDWQGIGAHETPPFAADPLPASDWSALSDQHPVWMTGGLDPVLLQEALQQLIAANGPMPLAGGLPVGQGPPMAPGPSGGGARGFSGPESDGKARSLPAQAASRAQRNAFGRNPVAQGARESNIPVAKQLIHAARQASPARQAPMKARDDLVDVASWRAPIYPLPVRETFRRPVAQAGRNMARPSTTSKVGR